MQRILLVISLVNFIFKLSKQIESAPLTETTAGPVVEEIGTLATNAGADKEVSEALGALEPGVVAGLLNWLFGKK